MTGEADQHAGASDGGRRLCVIAGDPSGDIAGFHFLRALRGRFPDVEVFGLGGERMRSLGQRQLARGSDLAALGFWEVARRWRFFSALLRETTNEITRLRPDAVVLMDYPGFNLRLAERISELKIPIIYYIAPQVWAWGSGRIPSLKRLVDRLLVILPFEVEFFADHGVTAEYVGHYLLDDIPGEFLGAAYNENSQFITLLPGSRQQEVDRMAETLFAAGRILNEQGWTCTVAAANEGLDFSAALRRFPEFAERIVIGRTRESIAESALVISSSGTATLETALIGRPLVVLYKTNWLTYHIARNLVKLPHIALANIVAGKTIAPEYIQGAATGEALASAATELMATPERRRAMVAEFSQALRRMELPAGVSPAEHVAAVVEEYLN